MKQTVQERADEMCEAWGMEDNHGYSVKDTFKVGFVQGANWQEKQSPWINVNERLPEENENVFFILTWRGIHREYYAGSYMEGKWRTEHRNYAPSSFWGVVTHWMPMPKINE